MTLSSLLIFVSVNATDADLTQGLVGYWPLDFLEAFDASGNGLDGTINGDVEATEDRFGTSASAMLFPGASNSYIDLGDQDAFQITSGMTLAAWVLLDSTNTNNGRIIAKMGGGGSRSWSLNIEAGNSDPTFQIAPDGNTIISTQDLDSLPRDEWVHMAGVYRPDVSTEIYVNGELKNILFEDIPELQYSDNGIPVFIGSRGACGNCGWLGAIDDVAIWNRDLFPDEVISLFENGLGGLPDLSCDLNGDSVCDTLDIDQLMQEVASGNNNTTVDLTGDGLVDDADRDVWLADAAMENGFAEPYLVGDSNLDGVNDAADLNALALNWQDANTNTWIGGNFTGTGVDAADLNGLALGWQQSIAAAGATAVPEPASLLLLMWPVIVGALVQRRRRVVGG
jgi:hypothetical protein